MAHCSVVGSGAPPCPVPVAWNSLVRLGEGGRRVVVSLVRQRMSQRITWRAAAGLQESGRWGRLEHVRTDPTAPLLPGSNWRRTFAPPPPPPPAEQLVAPSEPACNFQTGILVIV
ncbi:hypothetical protein GUJ93_ZPchr0010g9499 [Zizania palustris]|uniref:Uncharacterized protein n=1 Tax=Zizania palustris TaxID=103762 RepID=A0A8J5W9S5_ZIZPA|nr:hypothetical protein GUJ93_ZPchr0010g9499 [Zizania palustris]